MIHNTRRRIGARSLVVLTAMALPGVVPLLTAVPAQADGPVSARAKRHYKPAHGRGGKAAAGRPVKLKRKPSVPAKVAKLSLGTNSPGVPILPGRTYNWPFSVTNSGQIGAGPVVFTAPLPKSLEFVSAQQNCSFKGSMAVCELGSMKPGETKMGTLTAKVATSVKPREAIGATAAVTWGRSKVSQAFPQVNVAETADISVLKAGPALVRPGGVVPYEITVRNAGPAGAQNVMLTDVVEAKAPIEVIKSGSGCSQRGNGMVCSVGTLSSGQEKKVTLNIKVGPKARPGTVIQAPAKVTTSSIELNVANNQANVRTKVRVPQARPAVVRAQKIWVPKRTPQAGGAAPSQGMRELPRTGDESAVLVDVALALVGSGLILYRLGRRRPRRELGEA